MRNKRSRRSLKCTEDFLNVSNQGTNSNALLDQLFIPKGLKTGVRY